ncbi:MAG: N-acetylmuramoyl-L-alanine amidase, partial [Ruminococcus flavefaciens]|nr:N-acetylmuramoyl-L-alanine amidase [Ruminococcus flavefaciens]
SYVKGDNTMSNSSLVNCTMISPNKNSPRNHAIDTLTPHCVVGQLSAESIGGCFTSSSRGASCNYGIGVDGRVVLCVEEKDRSWCSSSSSNDHRAVTIECASDKTAPYAFNDVVYNKLIELCVDICRRNGKNKVVWLGSKEQELAYTPKSNEMLLTAHRWFANKSCPGDWLYSRYTDLANKINAALGTAATQAPTPKPTPSTGNGTKFAKNDVVNFKGSKHYTSSTGNTGSSCKPGKATITAVAAGAAHPYHVVAVSGEGSTVYGWVNESDITAITSGSKLPYSVKVKVPDLNIRKGPGTNCAKTGKYTGIGVFTIVEEANGPGAGKWGLLKSYKYGRNGWISLDSDFVDIL